MPKTYAQQVHDYARERFQLGYSPAETVRQMEKDTRLADYDLPTRRTVEYWFRSFKSEGASEVWSLEDTPDNAHIVLTHWKRATEWAIQNGFSIPIISKVLAQRLIWVHKAAPGIPFGLAWIVANSYFDSPNKAYWHLLLATKPWQSEEANGEFYRLAEALFGSPVGDTGDCHRRYPLGVTLFYLFKQTDTPPAKT